MATSSIKGYIDDLDFLVELFFHRVHMLNFAVHDVFIVLRNESNHIVQKNYQQ